MITDSYNGLAYLLSNSGSFAHLGRAPDVTVYCFPSYLAPLDSFSCVLDQSSPEIQAITLVITPGSPRIHKIKTVKATADEEKIPIRLATVTHALSNELWRHLQNTYPAGHAMR